LLDRYTGDDNGNITTYYAIPYATAQRFQVPQPIENERGLSSDKHVDASSHGPGCVNFNLPPPYDQGFATLLGTTPVEPQSENCLTLDVYVPNGNHKDLPVLVYTPGGGFLVGASFIYDMRPLVEKSIEIGQPFIAVAINYRLGPLGFLNPTTWGDDVNLGLLDQVEALRWVGD
jgi:para-nitrobenzyl esterase